jgi:hypothetical protein
MRAITLCILVLSELTALGGFAATKGPTAEQLNHAANGAYDRGDALRAISVYKGLRCNLIPSQPEPTSP